MELRMSARLTLLERRLNLNQAWQVLHKIHEDPLTDLPARVAKLLSSLPDSAILQKCNI